MSETADIRTELSRRLKGNVLLIGIGNTLRGDDGAGPALIERLEGRVKALLMDGRVVAGVGNIYANESLFFAGIHPGRPAGRIGLARYDRLSAAVRDVLQEAIRAGGTTLRDFVGGDGQPGYFGQQLRVYEREGEPCGGCGDSIRRRVIGQRASYFCPRCQR